jgi:alpha-tubulin suppressor-like RCC1 family protein
MKNNILMLLFVIQSLTTIIVAQTSHWVNAAAGGDSSFGIKSDGTLWDCGNNNYGQLGDGTIANRNTLTQVGTDANWKTISAGSIHAVALKTDGTLWAWGQNGGGQLGDGTNMDKSSPTLISAETNWQSISAGGYHSVAIKTDGTLWAWGYNGTGQLGDGTHTDILIPTQIGSDTNWKIVTGGAYHTIAIKTDGTLWAWGYNPYGQIGDGTNFWSSIPVQIGTETNWKSISAGAYHTLAIKTSGTLWAWGQNVNGRLGDGTTIDRNSPEQIGTDTNWQIVRAGGNHTIAMKSNGTLWAWGSNGNGQLGDGTTFDKSVPTLIGAETNWQTIAVGGYHTVGIKLAGLQFCSTGENSQGQLGDGTTISRNSFGCTTIIVPYSIICPSDKITNTDSGSCTAIVNNINPILTPIDATCTYSLSGATIGTGAGSASGVTFNKGETTVTYTLVDDATKSCNFMVTVNGEVAGALNFDGVNDYASIPALNLNSNNITLEAWIKPQGLQGEFDGIVFSRSGSTIAGFGIRANNEIEYHWNNDGLTYAWHSGAIAPPNEWSHVALVIEPTKATIYLNGVAYVNNVNHAVEEFDGMTWIGKDDPYILLSQDRQFTGDIDEVRIWNRPLCAAEIQNNMTGELTLPQSGLMAYYKFNQGLSSCENASITSLLDSSGNNFDGTLNNFALTGATSNWSSGTVSVTSPSFEHIPPVITCPANISLTIDAPATTTVVNFVATATDDSGISSITYSNDPGTTFPIGTTTVIATATDSNCNTSSCSFNVTVLENVSPQIHWVSISSGSEHTVGIKSDGTLWAWGNNSNGQLGDGTYTNRNGPLQIGTANNWKSIATGSYHTIAIKTDSTLWTWGYNAFGQLGDGINSNNRNIPAQIGTDSNWQSVTGGFDHTVAIKTDGTLWTWGNNGNGQLGNGTNIGTNRPLKIGTDTNWKSIAAGAYHTLGIKFDGTLWAWGFNIYGQLGDGTNVNKSLPIKIGTNTNWKSIESGYYSTEGIKSDGTLWAWGWGGNGNLGDGTNIDRNIPIKVGAATNWQSIDAGYAHTFGIQSDGTLWAWGFNVYGQLGDGTNIDKNIPIQIGIATSWKSITVGSIYSVGIQFDGLDFCATGNNDYGQLGDGTNITKNSFVCIPMPEPCILPIANAGSSATICAGSSTTIGATAVAGNTYNWVSSPAGFTSSSANPTVSPTVTTTYTLTETVTSTGCTKSNDVVIMVNPLPIANAGTPSTFCEGGSRTIGAVAVVGNTYSWVSNPVGFTSTMANPLVSPSVTTTYTVTETVTATGCAKSNIVTLTVDPMPIVSLGAYSPVCINGTPFALSGGLPLGGVYSGNGVSSGIFNPSVAGGGTHSIKYSSYNSSGCFTSEFSSIIVNPSPIAYVGTSTTICLGNSVAIGSTAVSGNTYSWVSSPVGFTSSSANPTVSPTVTTTYTLTETVTATGCAKSNSVTITVNPKVVPTVASVVQPTCAVPSGSIAITTQTGVEYSLDGTTYQASNTFAGLTPNNYTLYVRNITDNTCVTSSTSATTINAIKVVLIPTTTSVIQPTCAIPSGSISITPQTGVEYSLNGTAFQASNTFAGLAPNNYTLYVRNTSDNTCTNSSTLTVTINPIPNQLQVVTLKAFSSVCVNTAPFILTGGLPLGGTYSGTGVSLGSFNPSIGAGTYVITYTYNGGNGCSGSATSSIRVNSPPVANAGPNKIVYYGYSPTNCVTLSGSASGGVAPYKYLWSTGSKKASISVCPTQTTTYTLRVTDAKGCYQTDNVVVNVINVRCGKNKVKVCHSNTTICITADKVKAHLAHGDYLGTCTGPIVFAKNIDSSVVEDNDTFLLYPNPTTGSFTVEVCKSEVVDGAKLQVLNVLGQIIYSNKPFKIDGCIKETIELNNALPAGTYLLNLIIGDNVETKKIILTK